MFQDRVEIIVEAGHGGNGSRSFRREKYVPRGGPDGGDGGKGGDVILVGCGGLNTLYDLGARPHYRAGHGRNGAGAKKTGADGADVHLPVPPGTVAIDADTGDVLGEVLEDRQRVVIAQGGKGGKGNVHFATPTRRAPEKATPGQPGPRLRLRLELKLIAQVGLVGFPNAGKSTLITRLTHARAKIAEYPFTTVQPVLGTMPLSDHTSLVIADIPGLIEGAHEGAGMGFDFLRHIERTELLVYVLDITGRAGEDGLGAWRVLRREIECYDKEILERPSLVVLNKIDLLEESERKAALRRFVRSSRVAADRCLLVSGLERTGLEELKAAVERLHRQIAASRIALEEEAND